MPFEPTYGLPFEAGSDIPGWSLTGGPDGDQPVLAEAVAAQLRRIDDLVQALTDRLSIYPSRIQAGGGSITPTTTIVNTFYNADYYRGTLAVVFATAFTAAPAVMVTAETTLPGNVIECTVSSPTTAGCTLNLARTSQTATPMMWVASERTQA